jgi:hypothetical protein
MTAEQKPSTLLSFRKETDPHKLASSNGGLLPACRAHGDRGSPQGRADLRVPRRAGHVGHAGLGQRGLDRAARTPEAAAVLDTVVLVPPIVIVEVRICADERRIAHCTESSSARRQRGALLCAADDWHVCVCVLLARAPSNEVNC